MGADVRVLVGVEGAVRCRYLIIGILCIPHAEPVVVLGGEEDIAHARLFGQVGPFLRLEPQGVEGPVQAEILLLELLPCHLPADAARRKGRPRRRW